MNEIVPESPDKDSEGDDENSFVPETPQKEGSPQVSPRRYIPIPSLNHIRKSLGVLDNNFSHLEYNANILSPKSRRGTEKLSSSASKKSSKFKNFKNDKCLRLQKVKVSLFHTRFKESESKSFSVNAKSFYGSSSNKVPNTYALAPVRMKPAPTTSTKRSPVLKERKFSAKKHSKKKHKRGEINCGVGHGIKKPKRKRSSLTSDSMGSDKQDTSLSSAEKSCNSSIVEQKIVQHHTENVDTNNIVESKIVATYNPSNKFFKYKKRFADLLTCQHNDKKACVCKANVMTNESVTNLVASKSTSEHLDFLEKETEVLNQPLIRQQDIDDWNRLAGVDLDIGETNIPLGAVDHADDILKILQDDFMTISQTEENSISTVKNILTNESKGMVQNHDSSSESSIINLLEQNTFSKPENDSVSTSVLIESHEHIQNKSNIENNSLNLLENIIFNTQDIDNIVIDKKEEPFNQKDINDLLSILQDDWIDDTECEKNTAISENITYTNVQKKCLKNATVTSAIEKDLMNPTIDVSIDLQNNKEIIKEENKKQYYSLFYKKALSGIACSPTTKSRKQKLNRAFKKQSNDDKQYQIDAGQKLFGVIQCKECHLPYHLGDPDDEKSHEKYHNSFIVANFPGWKKERIVFEDLSTKSRICVVKTSDLSSHRRKVMDILEVINRDLGVIEPTFFDCPEDEVYLYIQNKTIIGLLAAKRIHTAFKLLSELSTTICCSSEKYPVKCGIHTVWTAENHRRQGVATKLMDILRTNYFFGYIMSTDDIAFSIPTPSGKAFAEKYTKTNVFVY